MKHKPVLMSKIQLEIKNEEARLKALESTLPAPVEIFDDKKSVSADKIEENESSDSFLLFLAQGFFRLMKDLFTKHIYVLVLLYFILRWLGLDLYPPFGDFIIKWTNKIWILVQNYFKKEFS